MDWTLDERVRDMVGGLDAHGDPVPLQRQHLVTEVERWPISQNTPHDIAEQLRISRELFVHCLLVWEFSAVGVAWSLMAVEATLRWALEAKESEPLVSLIKRGQSAGLYGPDTAELLDVGRKLRNSFSHPKSQPAFTIGMAAPMVEQSHRIVVKVSEAVAAGRARTRGTS